MNGSSYPRDINSLRSDRLQVSPMQSSHRLAPSSYTSMPSISRALISPPYTSTSSCYRSPSTTPVQRDFTPSNHHLHDAKSFHSATFPNSSCPTGTAQKLQPDSVTPTPSAESFPNSSYSTKPWQHENFPHFTNPARTDTASYNTFPQHTFPQQLNSAVSQPLSANTQSVKIPSLTIPVPSDGQRAVAAQLLHEDHMYAFYQSHGSANPASYIEEGKPAKWTFSVDQELWIHHFAVMYHVLAEIPSDMQSYESAFLKLWEARYRAQMNAYSLAAIKTSPHATSSVNTEVCKIVLEKLKRCAARMADISLDVVASKTAPKYHISRVHGCTDVYMDTA